ncbi:MAG: S9 family peptidase [Thaumarchaeota archaeon]|nr:S9 family peptidase [Nitrososphaerota archaeon]
MKPPHSKEAWELRSRELRSLLVDLMGGYPSRRGPLRPKVGKKQKKGGYSTEEVSFETVPEVRISALVAKPSRKEPGRLPAIIILHGTGQDKGMMEDDHFAELTRRGYLVIAIDQRHYTPRTLLSDMRLAQEAVVRGYCLYRNLSWDVTRTVDYLLSRDDVDGKRIGCTGLSLGGQMTWLAAALDKRIKVAAPACGVTTLESMFREGTDVWSSIGAFIPGMLKHTDVDEVVSLIAPRPLIILSATNDEIFPLSGAKEAYKFARAVYSLYDVEDRVRMFTDERFHSYSNKMRIAAYDWFDVWLTPGR